MMKHKTKIIAGVIIIATLLFAYLYGGDSPSPRSLDPNPANNAKVVANNNPSKDNEPSQTAKNTNPDTESKQKTENKADSSVLSDSKVEISGNDNLSPTSPDNTNKNETYSDDNAIQNKPTVPIQSDKEYSEANGMEIDESTGKDMYMTNPVPQGNPLPVEPQDNIISDKELTCILSVRCDTILNNISWLDEDKVDIVPKDGVIFAEKTVTFYEGESVFNVLLREMKQNKIHMEFENVPIYNSAYIEGISNLYEFDCGELSGWMYKVNGWFPNYGCSRYELKNGDKIEWLYTCDLGADIGAGYAQKP